MPVLNSIKNDFFGLCIPLAYYFCMLPDILDIRDRSLRITYNVYTRLVYLLAIFCHVGQLIKLFQILTDENFIFDELIRNYIITLYHFTALIKCIFVRGKLSGRIFRKVIKYEEHIYQSDNDDIKAVYQSTLKSVRNTTAYYLAGIVLVVVFYIAAPVFRDPYYIQKGNETIVVPQVPLSSWTLVDGHYWYEFIWTSASGAYLTIFFVTTDLICYSYIQALNGGLKNIMVLDFLPGSIQLAGMMFQMMTNFSVIQCILLGQFICTLIARIYIYCNSAHILTVQSQNLATAWYDVDWTELPRDVRSNIVLCIVRSQKPLHISIGNFQHISMTTFLAILKGTYSYMMLLTTI